MRVGRLTIRVLLIPLAVLAAGCGTTAAETARPVATPAAHQAGVRFENDFLALHYPASWKTLVFAPSGALHFDPMLYLSTQSGRNPCRTRAGTTQCGWPVARLHPNGILVVMENRGYPGWTLASTPGTPLDVDGRKARRQITRPGRCGAIGADETIAIAIARPLRDNWTDITACIRGPRLAQREDEIDAMLASTHFRTP